jgi:MFS family permease
VVGGALREIALEEAPPALRGAGQGLVNIFNAIGTLLSAAAIGAIADLNGHGVAGFALAYRVVAGCLLLGFIVTLALRRRAAPARSAD